jgi:DNA-binding NtrC family response regulator
MESKAWILIVDDEESVLGLMATVLKFAGYKTTTALDASEALLQCRGAGQLPDLLLTDILLHPAYTGCELARHMRMLVPGLPVVYVSGLGDSELVSEEVAQGGSAFLAKPFSPRTLVERVQETLTLRAAHVTAAKVV